MINTAQQNVPLPLPGAELVFIASGERKYFCNYSYNNVSGEERHFHFTFPSRITLQLMFWDVKPAVFTYLHISFAENRVLKIHSLRANAMCSMLKDLRPDF